MSVYRSKPVIPTSRGGRVTVLSFELMPRKRELAHFLRHLKHNIQKTKIMALHGK